MSEKYLGENSTPLLINQIKENCTQKRSTLPIASIDELGNTYQYTGTTSGSLVHGYFYECISDGAVTPTYTWQQVNIQPTAGTPTAATTTFDNTTSGLQATNVQDAIDEVDATVDGLSTDVDNIKDVVPSTATSSNKLVDHDSLGTAAFKDSTDRVSPNNTALVESQSVYSAINTALSSIYSPRGDITCAELTSSLLISENIGNVYETSDSGTTTALFLQGAGVPIPTGSNVGIINAGQGRILFNLMANAFDLTDYQKKDLTTAVEGQTTVEGALGLLEYKSATFPGTLDEWDALPASEKAKYDFIATPDEAVEDIADAIIDGDMRAITSNAVAQVVPSDASSSNKLVTVADIPSVKTISTPFTVNTGKATSVYEEEALKQGRVVQFKVYIESFKNIASETWNTLGTVVDAIKPAMETPLSMSDGRVINATALSRITPNGELQIWGTDTLNTLSSRFSATYFSAD